jgi:hypothetical protein
VRVALAQHELGQLVIAAESQPMRERVLVVPCEVGERRLRTRLSGPCPAIFLAGLVFGTHTLQKCTSGLDSCPFDLSALLGQIAFSNPRVLLAVWPSSDSPSHQRFAPMQADSVSRKCSCDHAPVVPARIVLPLAAARRAGRLSTLRAFNPRTRGPLGPRRFVRRAARRRRGMYGGSRC